MASGKSAVGAALAERLGWSHVDLDREIEREQGCSVAEIFRTGGESAFRVLEGEATARVAAGTEIVLSPGGGWITRPALLDSLGPDTLSVWLRVGVDEAVRRASAAPGERPLLAGPDPADAVRRLLIQREPLYSRAQLHLLTDGRSVPALADDIHSALRARGLAPR